MDLRADAAGPVTLWALAPYQSSARRRRQHRTPPLALLRQADRATVRDLHQPGLGCHFRHPLRLIEGDAKALVETHPRIQQTWKQTPKWEKGKRTESWACSVLD